MHVGHHRSDPAHVVVLAQRAFFARQQFADIALYRRLPVALVGHVDGEFLGRLRHLDVVVGQHKAAQLTVQGKAFNAITKGQQQHGLRAIDRVTSRHLLGTRLQEGFLTEVAFITIAIRATQHREDGADRNVDINVAGAVQRIENQQVSAFRVLTGNLVGIVHFFGRHAGQVTAPLVGFQQDFVGNHVEFLLHLALHVLGAHAAQHAAQCTLGYLMADFLTGPCDHFNKETQIGRGVVTTGLLDQVAAEGNAGHGWLREGRKIARSLPF